MKKLLQIGSDPSKGYINVGVDIFEAADFIAITGGPANAGLPIKTNSAGTLDSSMLPSSILGAVVYQGTWNASTNTPTLPAAAPGNKGWYYVVSVAGTQFGINFAAKDWVISDGVTWGQVNNSDVIYDHNNLSNLQGGSALERYHLTAAEHTTATTRSDSTHDGYLAATDWVVFNAKQAALTIGNLTEVTTSSLTISGGVGAVIGGGVSIALAQNIKPTSDVSFNSLYLTAGLKDANVTTPVHIGDASNTSLATINKTLVGAINELQSKIGSGVSAGVITQAAPTFTDNGLGSITIGATTVLIYQSSDFFVSMLQKNVPASTGLTLAAGVLSYVCVKQDLSGNAYYYVETNPEAITGSDVLLIFTAIYTNGSVYEKYNGSIGYGLPNRIQNALNRGYNQKRVMTYGGLRLSLTAV